MWKTRNEFRKLEVFMKDAGMKSTEELQKDLPVDIHHEPEYGPTESKLKRTNDNEVAVAKPIFQPKKIKRLQKNALKEEEAKQRCDKASNLQKQQSFDKLQSQASNITLFSKPKQPENDLKALSTAKLETTPKENILTDMPTLCLYRYPTCVNRSFHKFFGYMGHCTVLTENPIIEGSYYIEVTMLESNPLSTSRLKESERQLQTSVTETQPFVRVGIAKKNYKLLTPLGGSDSYCCCGKNGKVVNNRKPMLDLSAEEGFGPGDTIGIYFHMQPPLPVNDRVQTYVNVGSKLIFYKNGKQLAALDEIIQGYYVFAVSLYNWANVQFNEGPNFKYPVPFETKPYASIRSEQPLYKDLKHD